MSHSKKLATAALAGLLAASAIGTVANATDQQSGAKAEKSSTITAAADKHACKGQNSCKGQGADGKNSCKGQGSCATDGSKS